MKKKIFLLSIMSIVALTAASDEYIDPLTNVVYTYEPGQPTASVKAGYEEAVAPDYGYEGEVFYYPGSPDATGDVVILDKFTIGTTEYVVTSIDECAFWYNNKIKSVIIPNNVTDIGGGAFAHCNGLTSVTIGNGISSIGIGAFNFCSRLANVYCYAYNVPETSGYAFIDTPIASATLHVPAVSVEKYKATEPWQYFGNIVATASDIQHSGCLSRTRASSKSTTQSISLLKEGNILTVNLRNFWSTCDTQDFEVTPSVSDGNNSDPYTVSVRVKPIGEDIADCICPYNISFTIHDVEANSFYFKCWWFNGQVNLTEGEPWFMSNEYYPEGTKWTEIRLDTLKYDSWYSKVDDEWVPNFETVEYSVKGEYTPKYWEVPFKCVYTNSQECTDSLALLIYEGRDYGYDMGVLATVPLLFDDNTTPYPGEAYFFDWGVGMTLRFVDILSNNTTAIYPPGTFDFGIIEEIKEGNFGGVRPLKYTDVNGVRIIRGIGVTTWNDGECLFGPVKPYRAWSLFKEDYTRDERHYRSMLVHFERNGEVLYDVWPAKETVSFTKDQMATIILPTEPDASKGKYYRLDRCEKGKIIFEEELSPKARIPYIIVPKEDFCIDVSTLDLDGLLRDTVSVKGASFIGSYCHEELSCQDGFYIDIVDATPDCQADDSNQRKAIVGALRACLIVNWDDPYNPGGSKGITGKRELVLNDNPNGIESLIPNPSPSEKGTIYDLSGRKVNSQFSILNSQLKQKGLYIKDGKKILIK
ncbi:MAG: leucine-rich repeat domain-containing protein [Bacteroidaceae bacterium]|nr:leucine-rich repeat domain-containing protein [Bacteroidaceae bacterium]